MFLNQIYKSYCNISRWKEEQFDDSYDRALVIQVNDDLFQNIINGEVGSVLKKMIAFNSQKLNTEFTKTSFQRINTFKNHMIEQLIIKDKFGFIKHREFNRDEN